MKFKNFSHFTTFVHNEILQEQLDYLWAVGPEFGTDICVPLSIHYNSYDNSLTFHLAPAQFWKKNKTKLQS